MDGVAGAGAAGTEDLLEMVEWLELKMAGAEDGAVAAGDLLSMVGPVGAGYTWSLKMAEAAGAGGLLEIAEAVGTGVGGSCRSWR